VGKDIVGDKRSKGWGGGEMGRWGVSGESGGERGGLEGGEEGGEEHDRGLGEVW